MWRILGTYWWTTEKSSIFGVLGRSVGMLGCLMAKDRDILNLAPSSPPYHLGLKQGLMGLAGLGSQ
jgi:hypothetical protein